MILYLSTINLDIIVSCFYNVLMYRYTNNKNIREVATVFAKIKNQQEMQRFLDDILTPRELADVSQRWQIVKMLAKGVPQRVINGKLGVSISKITRGSRVLSDKKSMFFKLLVK